MKNNILSLLGLALRGGRLAVGEEPAALAARAGQARLLLAASDAADNALRRVESLAGQGHCLYLILPFSKAELGGALGRGSAAIAALTDLGLAAAVTERLAALDPERYGEAAQRMDLKRRRAKERQSAPHRPPPPPAEGEERRPRRNRSPNPSGKNRPKSRPPQSKRQSRGGTSAGDPAFRGAPGKSRPRRERPGQGRTAQDSLGGNSSRSRFQPSSRGAFERPGASRFHGEKRPGRGHPPKDKSGSGRGRGH